MMQNEGLAAPGEPSLEASRVTAVRVRRLASREQNLQRARELLVLQSSSM